MRTITNRILCFKLSYDVFNDGCKGLLVNFEVLLFGGNTLRLHIINHHIINSLYKNCLAVFSFYIKTRVLFLACFYPLVDKRS